MVENLSEKHNGDIAWGSSGPLREGKGSTYEGGLRIPSIVRWPGNVPAGRVSDAIFSTLDFMPTFANLAGYEMPSDRIIDGIDQTELLLGQSEKGAREDFFYFCQNEMHGVRTGKWKLILPDRQKFYNYVDDKGSGQIELYDLDSDIGESTNLASENPEIVQELLEKTRDFKWPQKMQEHRIFLNN